MKKVLALFLLSCCLRQMEESGEWFGEPLNPYLMQVVVPALEREEPLTIGDIDFDEFDADDPYTVLRYYNWSEKLREELRAMADRICEIRPTSAKKRSFL